MSAVLSFKDLTLGYGNQPAVQDLATEIAAGSLTAVVGPNGGGKSTLLKAVAGTLTPQHGSIGFGTLSRRNIAYLPQHSDLDKGFPLSVFDLVSMGLWQQIGPFGSLTRRHRQRVTEAIAAVGLTGFEKRSMGSLSGGQLQRALFARLLLQNAKIVLLDEPFNAIDSRTMADLIGVIQRWHDEGRTVVAVLHDVETVRKYFPETLMLAREMVAHGLTAHVLTEDNQFRARQMCEACLGPPHICGRDVVRGGDVA